MGLSLGVVSQGLLRLKLSTAALVMLKVSRSIFSSKRLRIQVGLPHGQEKRSAEARLIFPRAVQEKQEFARSSLQFASASRGAADPLRPHPCDNGRFGCSCGLTGVKQSLLERAGGLVTAK